MKNRLIFVVALVSSLAVFAAGQPVSAWSANGDASQLGPSSAGVYGSCSIMSNGNAGANTVNSVRELWGVCVNNPLATSTANAVTYLEQLPQLADVSEIRVCITSAGCSGTPFAANVTGASGLSVLNTFTTAACVGIANCVTYRATYTVKGTWNNMPAAGVNAHLLIFKSAGTAKTGCAGFCNTAHGTNGQPVVYDQPTSTDPVPPRHYWTEPWTSVLPACEDVSYGVRVNGTDYLMGLAGVSPAPTIGPSDTVLLVVEYPSDGPLNPGSFRWRQTPAQSFSVPIFIDTASVGGASASSYRLPITLVSDLADIELRCNSAEGDSYRRFGDSTWSAEPLVNRACSSLRMRMPEGDGSIIQVVDIVASSVLPAGDYAGGDVGVDVELRGWAHSGVETRSRFGGVVGGVAPFLYDIPVGHDGTTRFIDVDIDEPMLGWSYFTVRCFDSQGSLVLDDTGDSYVYDPESGTWSEADGFGDCLTGSGIGLNPASWVPAVGRMGVCIIRVSVVPSAAAMETRLDRFESLRDEPPVQWADEGVTYITGTDIEFADWATAGPECFDVIDTAVCPRTWTAGVTVPGWVVGVLLFGLWSSLVFAVWRWL